LNKSSDNDYNPVDSFTPKKADMLNFMTKKRLANGGHDMATDSQSMTEQIGITAGEIWKVLAADGGLSLTKLVKQVGAPRDLVMQAVGWLARENKIQIVEDKRVKTVSLLPEEASRVA
jgi:hypothetical protein